MSIFRITITVWPWGITIVKYWIRNTMDHLYLYNENSIKRSLVLK